MQPVLDRAGTRWQFRARVSVGGKQVVGRRRDTAKEAAADAARMVVARDGGPTKLWTLAEAMRLHLEDLEHRRKRPATVKWYRDRFRTLLPALGDVALHRIGPAEIEDFVRRRTTGEKPVSVATARADLRALSPLFALAIRRGRLALNPLRLASLPDTDHTPNPDWFAADELAKLLVRMRSTPLRGDVHLRDANVVEFLALTGLRLREACDMPVRDVSLPKARIVVHEGKRGRRYVRITPAIETLLLAFLDGRHEFPARAADPLLPLSYETVKTALRRWSVRLAEPRLHAHALRHTFGVQVARRTGDPYKVMKAMGHKTLAMSQVYVHLAGIDDAELDDLSYHVEPSAPPESPETQEARSS